MPLKFQNKEAGKKNFTFSTSKVSKVGFLAKPCTSGWQKQASEEGKKTFLKSTCFCKLEPPGLVSAGIFWHLPYCIKTEVQILQIIGNIKGIDCFSWSPPVQDFIWCNTTDVPKAPSQHSPPGVSKLPGHAQHIAGILGWQLWAGDSMQWNNQCNGSCSIILLSAVGHAYTPRCLWPDVKEENFFFLF